MLMLNFRVADFDTDLAVRVYEAGRDIGRKIDPQLA